jgi:hypothetical protein
VSVLQLLKCFASPTTDTAVPPPGSISDLRHVRLAKDCLVGHFLRQHRQGGPGSRDPAGAGMPLAWGETKDRHTDCPHEIKPLICPLWGCLRFRDAVSPLDASQ